MQGRLGVGVVKVSADAMRYEYKVVPAPAKGQKAKGVKSAEGRFALAIEQLLNDLGADGWEYQRADLLPSEERAGLTGSTTNWRNVLIFRRALEVGHASEIVPVAAPPIAAPVAAEPETPEVRAPEVQAPEETTPEVREPEVRAPEVRAPEVRAPEVSIPEGLRPVEAPAAQFEDVPEVDEKPEDAQPEFLARRRNPPAPQVNQPDDVGPSEALTGIERAMRQSGSHGPD